MADVVIAGAVRTPQGKLGGSLSCFTNQELGRLVLEALIHKNRIDPQEIDEVIFGCVGQYSDASNVSRVIALKAGLKQEIPAYTVNRNCASGLQAIASAYQAIATGDAELIAAGGVEVMSQAPYVNRDLRFGKRLRNSEMIDTLWEGLTDPVSGLLMGQTAENLAEEYKISRKEQDEYALLSHQRAFNATQLGKFRSELVEIEIRNKPGGKNTLPGIIDRDQGVDGETNLTKLSQLMPIFKEHGTVTAGNASSISDGAAAVIVTTREKANSLGLKILGAVRTYAFTGLAPERMGLGPVSAVSMALKKARIGQKEVQLFEINESFAAQYLAVERKLGLDRNRVNINGGAIALGHPIGASGARLVVTLLHEMQRQDLSIGLVSMCVGGGQGGAMIFEKS